MMRFRPLTAVAALLILSVTACRAQPSFLGEINPFGSHVGGIHLYSTYAYGAYMSSPFVASPFGFNVMPAVSPGFDFGREVLTGAGAALGWSHSSDTTTIAVIYSVSYTALPDHPEWNAFNHFLSFNANRKRGVTFGKWRAGFSGAGGARTSTEYLFSPTLLSRVADTSATFGDLAAGVLKGEPTNDQLASTLAGAPVPESPAQMLFFGNRILDASAAATLSCAYSSRLSVSMGVGASRSQSLPSGPEVDTQRYYSSFNATSGSANVGLSYSLSPRTQLGVSMGSTRTFSRFQDAYVTTGGVSLGRVMGPHWFINVHAGTGLITPVRETYTLPRGLGYTFGGGLGYKTTAHTFLVSQERTIGDAYAFGASSTLSTSVAWRWRRQGSGWSVFSSGEQQQMRGSAFGHINSWGASAGISRALTRRTGMSAVYSYMTNSGTFTSTPYNRPFYGVIVALHWAPGGERVR